MEYYDGHKEMNVTKKEDNSPVTKADLTANDLIISRLSEIFPSLPIVSEENKQEDNLSAMSNGEYFIIDPLDGTSSFIKKSGEFTVNIGFIRDQKPIFGVIYTPRKDEIHFTDENFTSRKITNFSRKNRNVINAADFIKVSEKNSDLRIICTKREPEKSEIIADLKRRNISVKEIISVASSYKFCLIAEGKADFYPRKAMISAWDVAAGHAIVKGAGGKMTDIKTGKEVEYRFDNADLTIPIFEVS